jgi:hypothetical protein
MKQGVKLTCETKDTKGKKTSDQRLIVVRNPLQSNEMCQLLLGIGLQRVGSALMTRSSLIWQLAFPKGLGAATGRPRVAPQYSSKI